MPRLFVALEIPRNAALSLSLLRGGLPGARWVEVENFHLTLRFIGKVDGPMADEIAGTLDRIGRNPFHLQLSGVGAFGSRKPHTVWAGISASPDLHALQGEIERAFQRIGLDPDPRKFTPHVTLARLRETTPEAVAGWLSARGNFSSEPFRVNRFVMMSSRGSAGDGPYVVEEAWPLAPQAGLAAHERAGPASRHSGRR